MSLRINTTSTWESPPQRIFEHGTTRDDIQRILYGDDTEAWYACPNCWELTETRICEYCGTAMDIHWQKLSLDDSELLTYEEPKLTSSKIDVILRGTIQKVSDIKTKWRLLEFSWNSYRVLCDPRKEKAIYAIYSSRKKVKVDSTTFTTIRNIALEIGKNYDKYGLSKLKFFKLY